MHFLLVIDENQSIEILGKIEDLPAGKVSMEIPQQIKGYNGRVKCGVYIDFSDGSKIDVRNLVFDLEKSLIDNVDYMPIKGNLFQTFDLALTEIKNYMDNVKQDTVSYADNQKSAMLAKTNEITSYGDTQKTAMNNILKDVQSTGNTAKTQIGQVLPDVQSKVSAINTELAKIDGNMPDLFVAYADNLSGGGFSKTDNTKLYKGYGVKNSTNPADYRWERNVDNLQVGGRNLFVDSGFKTDIFKDSGEYTPGKWYQYIATSFNYAQFDNDCRYTYFIGNNRDANGIMQFFGTNKLIKGETYSIRTQVKVDQATSFRYQLAKKNPDGTYNWYFRNIDITVSTLGEWSYLEWVFTIPKDDDATLYGLSLRNLKTGTNSTIQILKPKLEIGNMFTGFSLAHEDLMLNSNPINSILTTLSSENPSASLGGAWSQLGTETKFGKTIYYWKRTN